jgi:hypothetical protein
VDQQKRGPSEEFVYVYNANVFSLKSRKCFVGSTSFKEKKIVEEFTDTITALTGILLNTFLVTK